jgi:hypothetical protein
MIQWLKEVHLVSNPWVTPHCQRKKCVAALARGMATNYSIQNMFLGNYSECPGKKYRLVRHYVTLNYAGRKILHDSNNSKNHNPNVPLGLWPWILERAGTSLTCPPGAKDCKQRERERRINALFYFVQNSPSVTLSRGLDQKIQLGSNLRLDQDISEFKEKLSNPIFKNYD